jgi:hypothetical protein
MGDHAEVLVCRSDAPYRAAARAIARLVERKIIEAMPTDCVLAALGHRPGPRVGEAAEDASFVELAVNGLEVRLPHGVELFSPAQGEPASVSCPRCKYALEAELLYEHLMPHDPFAPTPLVSCPGCRDARPIEAWTAHDAAFGNVAFFFWNWTALRASFIVEMKEYCGAPLTLLHEHV